MKVRWILAFVLLAGAAYFALFGGEYGLFETRRLASERSLEQDRLRALQQELTQLRARSDSLQSDPAALERLAREKYGLIRDGERLYRFVDSAGSDSTGRSHPIPTPRR